MNNVISLDDLFHKRVFRIPDYQRGYSWESRQVQEFLEDLALLGSKKFHYTGTVVLHSLYSEPTSIDEDGNRYAPVDIVDGQQRLTTIVLLLDGIRRLLAESNRALSLGIYKNFVAAQATSGEPLYKLTLNADTDHFFRSHILSDDPSVEGPNNSSQERLALAKKYISNYLGSNAGNGRNATNWLYTLHEKITTQLRFTLYEVEHEAEVGIIFEVMNDRGKPLTELEKVKNFLLYASAYLRVPNNPNRLATTVNDAWAHILRQLMSAGLESSAYEDRLLRAHWLTHYDPTRKNWKGSRSIKDRFAVQKHQENTNALIKELHSYTESLRQDCIAFCDAYKPTRSSAFDSFGANSNIRRDVIDWSARLVRIGVVPPFLPLLLAARKRWPERPERYLELLKLCEAFAFRVYRVMRWRTDAGQSALFRIGYEVSKRQKDYSRMLESIKSELAYRCSDDDFRTEMNASKRDGWYDWRGLQYFLYEYEIFLASENDASPRVIWAELRDRELKDTIEHILPVSIDGRPYWQERFTEEKHQEFIHDLGNLTLTKHNSHYYNKPFPEKKGTVNANGHCYAKSPLYVERDLTRWNDWDASAIEERRGRLLEWARTRWVVNNR